MAMDRILEQKKGLKKKHLFWIGGGIILIAMILMIIFSDHSSVFRAEKDKLTISPVEKGLFNDYITVIGTLNPSPPFSWMPLKGDGYQNALSKKAVW